MLGVFAEFERGIIRERVNVRERAFSAWHYSKEVVHTRQAARGPRIDPQSR
jgi:hypothetical protein